MIPTSASRTHLSPKPTITQRSSTTTTSSATANSRVTSNASYLGLPYLRDSVDSSRSSDEATAVTIYSMYDDSPVDKPFLTARTSSRPSSGADELGVAFPSATDRLSVVSAGRHASSTALNAFHRPTSSIRSKHSSTDLLGVIDPIEPGPSNSNVSVSFSPPTPRTDSPNANANALQLLPLPSPNSRPSTAGSEKFHTPSQSPTTSFNQPSLEDVDSAHVRTTYARLDQSGVPGDGYEEGVERTRARAPSTVKQKRATMWPESKGELSEKEKEFLSTLDRFGFKSTSLSSRQENRLALIPAAALKKPPARTRTPPSSPPAPPEDLKDLPTPSDDPKELARIDKWGRMLRVSRRDAGGNVEQWSFDEKKGRKLRERIYKGVPDRWRSAVWWTLIDTSKVEIMSPPNSPSSKARLSAPELGRLYREWIDRPSTQDIQIDLDVPRTISGHVMFHTRYGAGQRLLFHVLHSFSLLCEECGYCQGMGPLAATLLCYLDAERAFAALVRIHDSYDMHSIFSPGFPGLLESIYVQERLTEQLLPDVFTSFKKHMISSTSYATKWYITLFANTFTFQTQLRLWDAFFLEGRDVVVVIALAIIWVLREHLASAQANFETILSLLSSFFVAESEDALLTWIGKALLDKKLRTSMTGWRSEWRELVRTGKDGNALM